MLIFGHLLIAVPAEENLDSSAHGALSLPPAVADCGWSDGVAVLAHLLLLQATPLNDWFFFPFFIVSRMSFQIFDFIGQSFNLLDVFFFDLAHLVNGGLFHLQLVLLLLHLVFEVAEAVMGRLILESESALALLAFGPSIGALFQVLLVCGS